MSAYRQNASAPAIHAFFDLYILIKQQPCDADKYEKCTALWTIKPAIWCRQQEQNRRKWLEMVHDNAVASCLPKLRIWGWVGCQIPTRRPRKHVALRCMCFEAWEVIAQAFQEEH